MKLNIIFGLFLLVLKIQAQSTEFVNYDFTYDENIKTAIIRSDFNTRPFPVIHLGSSSSFKLLFDDLSQKQRNFRYKIIQCDKDWKKSSLYDIEYLNGFNDLDIRDYELSQNTITNYTTFSLTIPNQFISISMSGFYLLHVYDDESLKPIITKRFIVSENTFSVDAIPKLDNDGILRKFNQRLEIKVSSEKIKPQDPMNQIQVTLIQNGDWNRSLTIGPRNVRFDQLYFDYIDKPSFPGIKNMRYFDARTIRAKTEFVENVEKYNNRVEVFLTTEVARGNKLNFSTPTLFGYQRNANIDDRINGPDYFMVHFYFKADYMLNHPLFVLGEFNNWGNDEANPPFEYDADNKYYKTTLLLKQGFYEYLLAEKLKNETFNFEYTEGNSSETENYYVALVTYRGYQDRSDRVVGFTEVVYNQ